MKNSKNSGLSKWGGVFRERERAGEEEMSEGPGGALSHLGGAAKGGPAPPVCETHTDSFSSPFLSRDFSYLVKTAKILKEELFAKLL